MTHDFEEETLISPPFDIYKRRNPAKAITPLGFTNKKAVGKNHIARVRLYADRFDKALDIYTGEPLEGDELADWNTSNAKRCIGDHLAEDQRKKHS